MEQVTLGQIEAWAVFILGLGGAVAGIIAGVKKVLKALFKEQMETLNKRLDQHDAQIKKIDLENCKNFLVSYLAKVESAGTTDEIETQRFWEEYEHYVQCGGNSYIRQKVDKLKAAGKL
jgi:hypothetical protein